MIWVLSGVLALAGLVWLVLGLIRLHRRTEARLRDDLAGQKMLHIDRWANFFGLTSRGITQIRGNGVLAVTADALHFRQLLPQRRLVVPRAAILAVDTPRSHLGKTKLSPLVRVTFRRDDGTEDSAAWLVADRHALLAALGTGASR